MKKFSLIISSLFFICQAYASTIILHAKSAAIWLPQQIIHGEIFDFKAQQVTVHVNDSTFILAVNQQHQFTISILLKQPINFIWAEAGKQQERIVSDTIQFDLGYTPLPLIHPFATSNGNKILLHASVKTNPYNLPLVFNWKADIRNPALASITNKHSGTATLELPFKKGDYYFNLEVITGKDTVHFQTMVTRSDSIHCFNLDKDHAAWIDAAIMYEITPDIFVKNGQYDDITEKLPELQQLGINTIWLQPVYKAHGGGQGYDVTDYFSLRKDIGDEQQLSGLIVKAKSLGMKIIFDFVPNHTSSYHPYAEDAALYQTDSHYYNFYQHEDDGAMYSSLYTQDPLGFYHYFWPKLVNLNYQNTEVQQWIIEACKYWIRKFDIDGYRFDATWALNARNPAFAKQLQLELKSLKPDILLLAEDKGANKEVYAQGYDAAYDWKKDTGWISRWSWQYDYDQQNNPTIFNYPAEEKRGKMLLNSLFENGDASHSRLRFIENNDQPRFIKDHGLDRTKMAAALLFALPGIPLIYNGQEIGFNAKVYSAKPVFNADENIESQDNLHLFSYYKLLAQKRLQYKSLYSLNMQSLPVSSNGSVVALHRWKEDEDFIIIINMSKNMQKVTVDLNNMGRNEKQKYFTDVLTNDSFQSLANTLILDIAAYSTKWLLLNKKKDDFVTDTGSVQ